MPELNKANRQVCDVDIRILKNKVPFLFFDTANTTTAGLTGDSVYAMAKGTKKIGFPNPIEGTMTIEAQVYPFKFFSLLADGTIKSDAVYAEVKDITAESAGELTITAPSNGTIASVMVYPKGSYGDAASAIEGTYASGTFNATTSGDIAKDSVYTVGYLVTRSSGVQRISFKNQEMPNDYYITMKTLDKDEEGVFTPFLITAYKANIKRDFELSFTSEGDPASVTLNFDLMEDKDANILDFVELTADAS